MSWLITGTQKTDPDALAYLSEVERADGQALESGTRDAVIAFVAGCKADGIWTAIKASCILAGARTLTGALVPLVGSAPTNFNFVAGDYARKTGLAGNGSTKYLNSNRNNNADPQDSNHNAAYISVAQSLAGPVIGGLSGGTSGANNIFWDSGANGLLMRSRTGDAVFQSFQGASSAPTGFVGHSRAIAASYTQRAYGSTITQINTSGAATNESIEVFRRGVGYSNARLSFYSIGESLNLALLDSRVTTLINAIDAAI